MTHLYELVVQSSVTSHDNRTKRIANAVWHFAKILFRTFTMIYLVQVMLQINALNTLESDDQFFAYRLVH